MQEEDHSLGHGSATDSTIGKSEYILNSGGRRENGNNGVEEDDHLLRDASLGLDNHPLAGLSDDSLGLTDTLELENDFPSDLLGGTLLGSANVEGLLHNDSLDLPDGFNLEEALQLVGLDEAQSEETKPEVKKEKDSIEESTCAKDESGITSSSSVEVAKSFRCEDPKSSDMIHTPQFHHPHHPHHRSFQTTRRVVSDSRRAIVDDSSQNPLART
ncbi:hypothetical protein K0M31_003724 [Melipona bicolor]|uniref:Uncharacterized protein n=1 Tax=Melipona bicolor TaxID=60889 RepID=A0AA40FY57_9HYME|nr:hypothetical protein K0M31_003724 [Melipona bicolor]